MKRMWMTAIMIFVAWVHVYCQEKMLMTGIDAIALAGGEASLSIEISIASHWSTGGNICYGFGKSMRGPQEVEISHRQEFGDTIFQPQPKDLHRETIYVKHWPVQMLKGPYLLTGISHGSDSGTGLDIGMGFLQHIWRQINIYTEYRLTVQKNDNRTNTLSAGICLTFGGRRKYTGF